MGGFETRPYVIVMIVRYHDDPVHMVRHAYKRIRDHAPVMPRQIIPTGPKNISPCVHPHIAIHRIPEQAFPFPGADCHKICPGTGIIVPT